MECSATKTILKSLCQCISKNISFHCRYRHPLFETYLHNCIELYTEYGYSDARTKELCTVQDWRWFRTEKTVDQVGSLIKIYGLYVCTIHSDKKTHWAWLERQSFDIFGNCSQFCRILHAALGSRFFLLSFCGTVFAMLLLFLSGASSTSCWPSSNWCWRFQGGKLLVRFQFRVASAWNRTIIVSQLISACVNSSVWYIFHV